MTITGELEPMLNGQAIPVTFNHLTKHSSEGDFLPYGYALSVANALPDGTPVPPTARHIAQASKEGWGVSEFTVKKALGSIVCLQEMLGFVMPATVSEWSTETFLENGIWISHILGSASNPVMPCYKDLQDFSKLHLAPSPVVTAERFGSIENYQDKLGYVNAKVTLKRWDDQDWIENGVWLSHMLGSPEEPKMPSYTDMRLASSVNIAPSVEEIRKQFGSLVEYQKALGFSPNEKPLDHEDWPKVTYVENGIWLSHMLGSPEEPKMPVTDDIYTGNAEGICPPFYAIKKRFRSLDKYQDALGFVTKATLARWSDQDWINNGIWLSHMLGSPEEPKMPIWSDLRRGNALNISPSELEVRQKFGSMQAYQEALGFKSPNSNRFKSNRDLLRAGLEIMRSKDGEVPRARDYKKAGLSVKQIYRRFGTLDNFHSFLDIPDYSDMTPEQLITFGVQWSISNNAMEAPRRTDLRKLRHVSKTSSPSEYSIVSQFGEYEKYTIAVEEALVIYYELLEKLSIINSLPKSIPEHLLRDFVPTDDYAEKQTEVAHKLVKLFRFDHVPVSVLQSMFNRSRMTIMWDEDDFLYFGEHAFGKKNLDVQSCLQKLEILDQAGLSPRLEDIREVFGSEQRFIEFVISH
ncbi:hypothetical protein KDA00_04770 [Candidatus Saccharibacteria bacterium]|nr:hypothetical protein [Candidatus Saccharibacteria bacterium]